jgi:hypothetical protein
MIFRTDSWRTIAGQDDVQRTLHVPMVYENVPTAVPQWEYRLVSVDPREEDLPAETALNELGAQGWMLVSVLAQSQSERDFRIHYYFVRQKQA